MSKKDFSGGIDSLFNTSTNENKQNKTSNEETNKDLCTRTTLIVKIETYEKIKAISYWERKPVKDIIEKAFYSVLSDYSIEKLNEIVEYYKQNNT